jgi:hypothetical protein
MPVQVPVLKYSDIRILYSGFLYEPQLASRDAGAPPARRVRGAVGGTGHIATRNRHGPFSFSFSEFDNMYCLFAEPGERGAWQRRRGAGELFLKKIRAVPVFWTSNLIGKNNSNYSFSNHNNCSCALGSWFKNISYVRVKR